jgi:DNA-binding LacI/PurR family transcriptional regulator
VSYVLNNVVHVKVSEATRQRVLDAINDLEYRPNEYAQRLKQGGDAAQNSIGIVTGGKSYNLIERPYYNIMLSGLYDYAYQQNQQISFLAYWDALKDPIFFNKHIHEQEISSLILILPSLIPDHKDDIALLNQTIERIPYNLCIDDSVLYLPSIIFDRAEAARCVMNHLIGLGHKRIAFVAVNDHRCVRGTVRRRPCKPSPIHPEAAPDPPRSKPRQRRPRPDKGTRLWDGAIRAGWTRPGIVRANAATPR